jgi:type IV secretion system protein VirB9
MNAKLMWVAALCACFASQPDLAFAHARRAHAQSETPIATLAAANDASRQRPSRARFEHARQVYTYEPGAIYELYANPAYVSTILLEPGESLVNIAAGDTSRWMVTQAEGDDAGRTIVLIKPQTVNLRTNVVLITDRRTYLVEAISQAGAAYSAQVAWSYPQDQSVNAAPAIASLNFDYRVRAVRGRTPAWTPVRVYDDGRRTWIEFSPDVVASDLPPLFVVTADGAELVNYRVQAGAPGQRYMLDRVFDVAELRLGTRAQTIVRIERHPQTQATTTVRHGPRG